jgi:hypothetical protein
MNEKGAAKKGRLFLWPAQIKNRAIASDQGILSEPIFELNEHPGSRQVGQASGPCRPDGKTTAWTRYNFTEQ